jgi:cytochrome c
MYSSRILCVAAGLLLLTIAIFYSCKSTRPTPAASAVTSAKDTIVQTAVSAVELPAPEDNRFTKTVLSNDLNEPMELAVAPDGRVFFTERSGKCYVYSPVTNSTRLLRDFPVKAVEKYLNGLIGVTLDPDFVENRFIYFFYSSSTGDEVHQNVSRFTLTQAGELDTTSEKIIIKIPVDLEVSAHTGGSLAWDRDKNLFISTGDNTVPFESDGYAPIDERQGRHTFDAQRSAGNTQDFKNSPRARWLIHDSRRQSFSKRHKRNKT